MMANEKIKQLQQQKEQKEQQIKEFVEQLAILSDEAKKNTEQQIIALEQTREQLSADLLQELKQELASTTQEVEKEGIQKLIEKYEREERENQSYYIGVTQLLEQYGDTDIEKFLQQVIKETKKQRTIEQPQTSEHLTHSLLINNQEPYNTTAESLKVVLQNDVFKEYGKDTDERLKNILERVHTTINTYVYGAFNIDTQNPNEDADIKEIISQVITPAIERYVLDFLKRNGNTNNVSQLDSINGISFESFINLLSGVGNFAKTATDTFFKGKGLITAIDYLGVHKHQLKQAKKSEILRNPLKCMEFLQNPLRAGEVNIRKIPMKNVGITFDQEEQSYGLSPQEAEEVKEKIATIPVVNNPETTKLILSLTEKAGNFFEARTELANQAMDLLDLSEGSLAVFEMIGVDVIGEIQDSKLIKGVLNFVLSILGFSGGLDGLLKRRYTRKIEKELDEGKREEIKTIFDTYLADTSTKEEKNSLKTLFKKKIPDQAKEFFNIDAPTLSKSMDEHLSFEQINPNMLSALGESQYIKQTSFTDEEGKQQKKLTINPDKKEQREQHKEKIIKKYLAYMTEHLAGNPKYLKSLAEATTEDDRDTPANKVLFTMISARYVTEKNIVDGVKAEAFLPSGFIDNTQQNTQQPTQQGVVTPWATATPWIDPIPWTPEIAEPTKIAEHALNITILGESRGNYGAVNKNDVNGVSLGILQWHKERAGSLLKRLKNADTASFTEKMTDSLFQDLDTAGNVAWNETQTQQFKSLMENEVFQKEMKQQAIEDMNGYIEKIKKLGVSKPSALILLARLRNAGATRCKEQIIDKLSPDDRNNPDKIFEQFSQTNYAKKRWTHSLELAQAEIAKLDVNNLA